MLAHGEVDQVELLDVVVGDGQHADVSVGLSGGDGAQGGRGVGKFYENRRRLAALEHVARGVAFLDGHPYAFKTGRQGEAAGVAAGDDDGR